MPESTPQGDGHYNTKLKGDRRKTAIELIKKYWHQRGYAVAISSYLGTTEHTIRNLKRKGWHLDPSVKVSELEIPITCWTKKKSRPPRPKNSAADRRRIAGHIRRRFHKAPTNERSGLLLQFEQEYGHCGAWIRRILKREVYPEIEPDIPIPTEWGIGRRKSFKRKLKNGGDQ